MTRSWESSLKQVGSIVLGILLLAHSAGYAQTDPPPITVMVMVDQLRADVLRRFHDQFEGGLARLLAEGVVFSDMHHDHAFALTATGHAVLLTGSHPNHTGISSNVYWDRTKRRLVNAVEDLTVTILGAPSDTGRSPQAMRRPALGDWLKADSPNSKVFVVSGKDRSGILAGGKAPDDVYWYHRPSGQFVTSTYYRDTLPDWVAEFNEQDYARGLFGDGWERMLPEEAYERSREDDFAPERRGKGATFPHRPDGEDSGLTFYEQFALTPLLDDLTFRFAKQMLEVEDLGTDDAPDLLFIPVGNAGNITAYWKGFQEYHQGGHASRRPVMMGYEAEGAAPIATGVPVAEPKTVASALRIGNPASWAGALTARDESGGDIATVSDGEILSAYQLLARSEGIFCEAASAASVAGLIKRVKAGADLRQRNVVCIITGHGLKDPAMVTELAHRPLEESPAELEAVAQLVLAPRSAG